MSNPAGGETIAVLRASLISPIMDIDKFASKLKPTARPLCISPSTSFEKSGTSNPFSPVFSPFSSSVSCPHNIRVVARVRPLSTKEAARGCQSRVHASCAVSNRLDEENIDPGSEEHISTCGAHSQGTTSIVNVDTAVAGGGREFEFDSAVDGDATQAQVYKSTVGDAIRQTVFLGYNFTILAYGQTSSGKTYTMLGDGEQNNCDSSLKMRRNINTASSITNTTNPKKQTLSSPNSYELLETDGILPRVLLDLFQAKEECNGKVNISMSFLELYNDELLDLFTDADTTDLKLKDHGADGVHVDGLSVKSVDTTVEAIRLMTLASNRRVVSASSLNAASSRSHAICMLYVTIQYDATNIVHAKLTLVDLAGSERLKKTLAEGKQKQEGININKDLFELGNVISALAVKGNQKKLRGNSKNVHIPYRNSKLTQILRVALGGNCYTVMVACVSPASENVEESINTLRYANRARAIKNSALQNTTPAITSPRDYEDEIFRLRQENEILRAQLPELDPLTTVKSSEDFPLRCIVETQDVATTTSHYKNDNDYLFSPLLSDQESSLDLSSEFWMTNESVDPATPNKVKPSSQKSETSALYVSDSIKTQSEESGHAWEHLIKMKNEIDAQIVMAASNRDSLHGEISSLTSQAEALRGENAGILKVIEERKLDASRLEHVVTCLSAGEKRLQHQNQLLTAEPAGLMRKAEAHYGIDVMVSELERERESRKSCEDEIKRLRSIVHNLNYVISAEETRLKNRNQLLTEERNTLLHEVQSQRGNAAMSSELAEERKLRERCQDEMGRCHSIVNDLQRDKRDLILKITALERNERKSPDNASSTQSNLMGQHSQTVQEKIIRKSTRPPRHSISNVLHLEIDTASKGSTKRCKSEQSEDLNKQIRIDAAMLLHRASQPVVARNHGTNAASSIASKESWQTNSGEKSTNFPACRSRQTNGTGGISCSMTVLQQQQDPSIADLFLPKFDFNCSCEDCQQWTRGNGCNPSLVSDILRTWQAEFLASMGITTLQDLILEAEKNSRVLSKAMLKWRERKKMKVVNKKSCKIALHIWSRTASVVIKNAQTGGQEARTLQEIRMFDDNASVSTLGCPDEFEI